MVKKTGDPVQLKARLEAALKVLKPKEILTADPMAKAIGMTWFGFRKIYVDADPNFPIKKRGDNGSQYEFEAVKVIRYMIRICEKRIAANDERNRRNAEIAGIQVPEAEAGSDIAEIAKLADLTLRTVAAKERQGLYTPARATADFLSGYNNAVVNGILGVSSQIDPTGMLPASVRAAMDDELRSIAVSVDAMAREYIEKNLNADIREGRTQRRA